MSEIKEFVSANTLFSKTKLWVPIFFTAIMGLSLLNDFFSESLNILELVSTTWFTLIYIISFWMMQFFTGEYSRLNEFIKNKATDPQPIFSEEHEHSFQTRVKKFRVAVLVLILALLAFEVFRLLYNNVSLPNIVKLVVFVLLLMCSILSFIASWIRSRRLLQFLKSITIKNRNY